MRELLEALIARRDLDAAQMEALMERMLTGDSTHAQTAAALIALRMKGETSTEIAAAARVMRRHAVPVVVHGDGPLIDTCGTGGDGSESFNVSTAAAIVVAACGARVAKHGNRAASSRSGSADVLEAAGVSLDMSAERIARCIEQVGIGFMFARAHHPAMKHAAPVRAELGVRTLFNFLGPLTNPAGATHQLLGVGDATRVRQLAEVLQLLGSTGAWVVHGDGGLDEVSISGPTRVVELRDGSLHERTINPEDFGLPRSDVRELRGGDARENAAIMRALFAGKRDARRDAVVANAAAALCAAGLEREPRTAALRVAAAIDSGAALRTLDAWVDFGRAS